jgi:hypothetical protein
VARESTPVGVGVGLAEQAIPVNPLCVVLRRFAPEVFSALSLNEGSHCPAAAGLAHVLGDLTLFQRNKTAA